MPPKPRAKPRRQPARGLELGSRRNLLVALGGAALLAAALIVASVAFRGGSSSRTTVVGDTAAVDGIAQSGATLGSSSAPVTLIEYADTSCPICRRYTLETFPTLAREYVRTGRVKVEWRGMAFVGPSSEKGQRLVLAAGRQNKLWQLADLLYRNQGDERTAWLTDDYARRIAARIPGLDVDRLFRDMDGPQVREAARRSEQQAVADRVPGTPTFLLQVGAKKPYSLALSSLAASAFRPALDAALEG